MSKPTEWQKKVWEAAEHLEKLGNLEIRRAPDGTHLEYRLTAKGIAEQEKNAQSKPNAI